MALQRGQRNLHVLLNLKGAACTSRHLTGGVPNLLDVTYTAGALIGRSAVVKGDEYTVTVYDPKKAAAKTVTLTPDATGEIEWKYEG